MAPAYCSAFDLFYIHMDSVQILPAVKQNPCI